MNAANRIFPLSIPVATATKFGTKFGYNSNCVRDICEMFVSISKVFGDGPANAANRILPRLTLFAMGTKFGTKWAITRHNVGDISEILASKKGF